MLFETYLTNEDIKALSTGKMYDRFDGEYFETKKGLAILEDGYVDIELNICENYSSWENGKEIEPAYYICQKCVAADMFEFWEDVGYADEILPIDECYPNIDWTGDYKKQLREDMERVLKLYIEKAGLYFDKPNKSLTMEENE